MKYVSALFAFVLFGVAGIATATEHHAFEFQYNNHNSYYACSYVGQQAVKTLTVLGAENIDVNCHGGIDNGNLYPVALTGTFTHTDKGVRVVVLRGRESCDMNVSLIKTLLATVEHKVIKAQSSCWDAQGSYRFEIELQ